MLDRLFNFSGAAFLIGVVLVVGVLAYDELFSGETIFAPLTVSDVTINSRVDGLDGPAVRVGDHYNGTITICNDDDEAQAITFVIQLEDLDDSVHFVSLGSVEFPIEPGCETFTGDSAPLPDEITPGLWRESSVAIVQRGAQKQTVSFVSEPFEVVP